MQWIRQTQALVARQWPRATAWGALLERQEVLLVALSLQKTGGMRVVVFEHLHAPSGLVHHAEGDQWLSQTLVTLADRMPGRFKTMGLALGPERYRQGVVDWEGGLDLRRLQTQVAHEAATAWGTALAGVGFDFRIQEAAAQPRARVEWAACLREDVQRWQQAARTAGWRLTLLETASQAAQRAMRHLQGDLQQHWALSPRDWLFQRQPQRPPEQLEGTAWQTETVWKSLVACGAALGTLP